jgi:hypothetical protein
MCEEVVMKRCALVFVLAVGCGGEAPVAFDVVEQGAAALTASACDHPLLPQAGVKRRFSWTASHAQQTQGTVLTLETTTAEAVPSGELLVRWRSDLSSSKTPLTLSRELTTHCAPGAGAEMPWVGLAERLTGLTPRTPLVRWPRHLATGVEFGGTVRLGSGEGDDALTVEQRYRVAGPQSVKTKSGTVAGWKIDLALVYRMGQRVESGTGTLVVGPGLGLVSSSIRSGQGREEKLTALGL